MREALSGSVKLHNLNHGLDGLQDDTDGGVRDMAFPETVKLHNLNHGLDGLQDDTDGGVRDMALSDSVKSVNPWQSVIQTEGTDHG